MTRRADRSCPGFLRLLNKQPQVQRLETKQMCYLSIQGVRSRKLEVWARLFSSWALWGKAFFSFRLLQALLPGSWPLRRPRGQHHRACPDLLVASHLL